MYTPHEVRTIIRNCKTIAELFRVEMELVIDAEKYTLLQNKAFDAEILRQKLNIHRCQA